MAAVTERQSAGGGRVAAEAAGSCCSRTEDGRGEERVQPLASASERTGGLLVGRPTNQ